MDDSPSFETWLDLRREELSVRWQDVCLSHITDLESAGEHREAAAIAKRLLQHDSLAEDAVQSYIRNAYLAGRRESALHAAATFRRELLRETGLEPLPETERLIEAVERCQPLARPVAQHKYGRRSTDRPTSSKDQQLAELLELLQDPNARLLDLSAIQEANESLVISRRVQDVPVALHAIVDLSEGLMAQGHSRRAGELLALVLKHTLCDDKLRTKAHHLQSSLEAQASSR